MPSFNRLLFVSLGSLLACSSTQPGAMPGTPSNQGATQDTRSHEEATQDTPSNEEATPDTPSNEGATPDTPSNEKSTEPCTVRTTPARFPSPERIVAMGDFHGDLAATRRILQKAGLTDAGDNWIGGRTVFVHVGDVLDRGNDEPEVIELLAKLREQAASAGGAVHTLHGNHELMNTAGDFRYVTPEGFTDFAHVEARPALAAEVARFNERFRGRAAAFLPGGPWAERLAANDTAIVVGDSVFVHGGLLPAFAADLPGLNQRIRCWLTGQGPMPPEVNDPSGPLWSREYSRAPEACDALEESLSALGAMRMIVGHTPQLAGITSACQQKVWRIDVGLAAHYGGPSQALEIRGSEISVIE